MCSTESTFGPPRRFMRWPRGSRGTATSAINTFTVMNWEDLSPTLKQRLIRDNPDKLTAAGLIPAVGGQKPEPVQRSGGQDCSLEEVRQRLGYRITILSMRRRLVDEHDNLPAAHKPLVDRITQSLGFKSDSDPRLEWNYSQVVIKGRPGTIVQIDPFLI